MGRSEEEADGSPSVPPPPRPSGTRPQPPPRGRHGPEGTGLCPRQPGTPCNLLHPRGRGNRWARDPVGAGLGGAGWEYILLSPERLSRVCLTVLGTARHHGCYQSQPLAPQLLSGAPWPLCWGWGLWPAQPSAPCPPSGAMGYHGVPVPAPPRADLAGTGVPTGSTRHRRHIPASPCACPRGPGVAKLPSK